MLSCAGFYILVLFLLLSNRSIIMIKIEIKRENNKNIYHYSSEIATNIKKTKTYTHTHTHTEYINNNKIYSNRLEPSILYVFVVVYYLKNTYLYIICNKSNRICTKYTDFFMLSRIDLIENSLVRFDSSSSSSSAC